MRFGTLFVTAYWLFACSPRGEAQEVIDVIHLSPEEATLARQTVQSLLIAQDRAKSALFSWRNFNQTYQAAHPELPNMKFSSDFRVAFSVKRTGDRFGDEAMVVELSAEERKTAETLQRDALETTRRLNEAAKSWQDYQNEFVAGHVPATGFEESGSRIILPSGKAVFIPQLWSSGVAFTSNFRVAVPRRSP